MLKKITYITPDKVRQQTEQLNRMFRRHLGLITNLNASAASAISALNSSAWDAISAANSSAWGSISAERILAHDVV